MDIDNSIQSRMNAAEFFIQHGTQKKITIGYCGTLSGFTEREYESSKINEKTTRKGTHWLRGDSAYIAVRALRLFSTLYGIKKIDKPLNAAEFHRLCNTYFIKYPLDTEMTTNRMHYLIVAIRKLEVVTHKECSTCHNPFITHREEAHNRVCSICSE